MTEGWIKVYRKLSEKSFYRKDSEAVHLWVHILFCANRNKREESLGGKKIVCNPGQFTTGRKQLSEDTGINESKIERLLNKFEKIEQQIKQEKTNTNRLISVCNWNEYQTNEQDSEQQPNNNRTTIEQQLNTLQEYKKLKNKEEIDVFEKFRDILIDWFEYKKKRRESYKSEKSMSEFYDKILKMSNKDPIIATQIIKQSMASNWAGIFYLKQNNGYSKKEDYKIEDLNFEP